MNKEIQEYLQGQSHDFNQGFALFCKYSRNESLMSWIGRKMDMEKLIYELQKLSKVEPRENVMQVRHINRYNRYLNMAPHGKTIDEVPEAGTEKIVFKTFDERRTKRADLPENLQKVYDDIAADYKLARGYHEKMKASGDQSERARNRALLMETRERIEKGWKVIDAYLLDQAKNKVDSEFKESTCRSYVSKMLNKGSLTPEQIEKLRIRVDALVAHDCQFSEEVTVQLKELKLL